MNVSVIWFILETLFLLSWFNLELTSGKLLADPSTVTSYPRRNVFLEKKGYESVGVEALALDSAFTG